MQNENFYNKNTNSDINACTSRGACSLAPNIAALQELLILLLKEEAHYLLELQSAGADNNKINLDIINDIASLVSVNEFSENQLYSIVLDNYYRLCNIKETYYEICKKMNIMSKDLESSVQFSEKVPVSRAIALGERIFLENYKKMSLIQKNLTDILAILIKSICIHLVKSSDFNSFDTNAYIQMLKSLDFMNKHSINEIDLKNQIEQLAREDSRIQLKISSMLLDEFGGISKVNVSHSTNKGKAILVSGNNFFDLLNVLEQTKDRNIDIYTHSNLLITHALNKFRDYPNLKGHYGDTTESCILDFATFPGAILLTKNSKSNTDYLYRGRLFSTDYTVPQGVIKIENNNFEELINSAIESKGFKRGKLKQDSVVGYDIDEVDKKLDKIAQGLISGKISHLYIIGMDSYSEYQKEYYKQFFSKMKRDEYAISFFYESNNKNVFTINIGNYLPLVTNIVKNFLDKYSIENNKITFFCTTCNVMTISNIVMLKVRGANSIYMSDCSPTMINPSTMETFIKEYGVNITSDAITDIKYIRKN